MVNNWSAAVGAFIPTKTTLCLSTTATSLARPALPVPISITHGATTIFVNAAVDGVASGTAIPVTGSSTKAEDVSLIGTLSGGSTAAVDLLTSNNYVVSNEDIYSLSNGIVGGTSASTKGLIGGNYTVIAHYAGDGTYGASNSTSPISVTVSPEASTTNLSTQIFNFNTVAGILASQAYYGDSILVRADVVGVSRTRVGHWNSDDFGRYKEPRWIPAEHGGLHRRSDCLGRYRGIYPATRRRSSQLYGQLRR